MKFLKTLDVKVSYLPSPASDPDLAYSTWCSAILSTEKTSFPRGCRPYLMPSWDMEYQHAHDKYIIESPGHDANSKAMKLSNILDAKHRKWWEMSMASIVNFTHSSRKVWQTFNHLTGHTKKTPPSVISEKVIASVLIKIEHTVMWTSLSEGILTRRWLPSGVNCDVETPLMLTGIET